MKSSENIYYRARMKAAATSHLFASRDRAAEAIYISAEALSDYETGATLPPCDVVCKMVEAYNDPALKGAHIRGNCPLMPDYGDTHSGGLEQAALSWMLLMADSKSGTHEAAVRFAQLAQDGHLDAQERAEAQEIRAKAVKLRQTMDLAINAIDHALREGQRGERP